jgi:hypothetical protein
MTDEMLWQKFGACLGSFLPLFAFARLLDLCPSTIVRLRARLRRLLLLLLLRRIIF